MNSYPVRRGDIFYATLGEKVGSVQKYDRPVLVIQNDTGNIYSTTIIVAPITSKIITKKSLPTHVIFNVEAMPQKSVVLLEQITTIDKIQLINYIGKIPENIMNEVDESIKISLALTGKE